MGREFSRYEAAPGVSGGEWAEEIPPTRHLAPVAQPPAGAAPMRMPVKTQEIALDGDWAGWRFTVQRNAPLDVLLRLEELKSDASDLGALIAVLPAIIIRWNFVDTQGEPLPLTTAGLRQLPLELFQAVMEAFGALINAQVTVPKP